LLPLPARVAIGQRVNLVISRLLTKAGVPPSRAVEASDAAGLTTASLRLSYCLSLTLCYLHGGVLVVAVAIHGESVHKEEKDKASGPIGPMTGATAMKAILDAMRTQIDSSVGQLPVRNELQSLPAHENLATLASLLVAFMIPCDDAEDNLRCAAEERLAVVARRGRLYAPQARFGSDMAQMRTSVDAFLKEVAEHMGAAEVMLAHLMTTATKKPIKLGPPAGALLVWMSDGLLDSTEWRL
jgi:hypothetical protein